MKEVAPKEPDCAIFPETVELQACRGINRDRSQMDAGDSKGARLIAQNYSPSWMASLNVNCSRHKVNDFLQRVCRRSILESPFLGKSIAWARTRDGFRRPWLPLCRCFLGGLEQDRKRGFSDKYNNINILFGLYGADSSFCPKADF